MSCASSNPPTYCPSASLELKLHQAFIYSGPVFFAFMLVLVFFLLYLRWRRANWRSIQMRAIQLSRGESPRPADTGIKKEVREMLPVVVFKESFLIRETQCSVCLGDYQSDERLQKIPPCGHTFHVDCIDHWLASNTTCPLCRISLLPASKTATNAVSYEDQAIVGEGSEEQSAEGQSSGRIIPQEEGNGRCGSATDEHLEHLRREEESKHQEEGCVIINIETHSNVEGGIRS